VKNILTSIIGITTNTARTSTSVSDLQYKLLGRFYSLSRVHGLLIDATWTEASIADVINSTLKPYAEAEPDRIVVEGPDMPITANAALALNMALHELATNAIKYGALSSERGRVKVSWASAARSAPLTLTWEEVDGPIVVPPRAPGFGTRVLELAFGGIEGSKVNLDYPPKGVICEIRLGRRALGGAATNKFDSHKR